MISIVGIKIKFFLSSKAIKMKAIISSIFKTFFLSLCVIANTHFAYAQTAASILPPAKTQLLDNNGKPLVSGTVDYYVPGTTTRKTTWQDSGKTIANANPVVLDGGGRALMLGDGSYRQVVKDRTGNIIWDQITSSTGSGGGGGSATVGDGQPVGSIQLWGGFVAPAQYAFAYGQEFVRTSFPEFFQAITLNKDVSCTLGSPTINVTDTAQLPIGAPIESTCLNAGSTVIAKTISTITASTNAIISSNSTARFFPYGNGDGSTTFNAPDYRGKAPIGRCNMGDIDCSNLNATYFGSNPSALGANGGNQNRTLVTGNLPPYTPVGSISSPTTVNNAASAASMTSTNMAYATGGSNNNFILGTVTGATTTVTSTFTGTAQGGTSTPLSVVQPSITANYVIKTTPDSNPNSFFGVASLGGMTGVISCGSGLTCAGNTISAVGGGGGSTPAWDNTGLSITSAYNVNITDTTKTITASGNATYDINFGDPAGFPAKFNVMVANADNANVKTIVLNGQGNYTLAPKQSSFVYLQNGKWFVNVNLPEINVKDFGAKGDALSVYGVGSMTSGSATLTVSAGYFSATDVGKQIDVAGAGAAGAYLHSTIATFISPTQVNLNNAASTTVTGTSIQWGTDDNASIQAALDYANGQVVLFQPNLAVAGTYIQAIPVVNFPRGSYYSSGGNNTGQAMRLKAYGAVFMGPPSGFLSGGSAFFQAFAANNTTGPFNGRQFYIDGGVFSVMPGHIVIYNGNVGGGKFESRDTEFYGAINNSVTLQMESSTIDFYNPYWVQNGRTLQLVNRTWGAVSQTRIMGGTIVPKAFNTSNNFTIFVDGCSTNGTPCTLGVGNQASSDMLDIEETLFITEPASGVVTNPAYIQWNDGGMLYIRNNRFSQEAGGVAIVNANTKWRTANLTTTVNPPANIVMQNNALYADPNMINDSNAGIRLFQIPNKIEFTNNYGHAVTGPVLATAPGVNLATILSGAGSPNFNLTFGGNQFANNVTTNEYLLVPTLLRAYMAPLNTAYVNANAYNLYGNTSGVTTLNVPNSAGNYVFTLPPNVGTSGQALLTNGAGVTSWGGIGIAGGGTGYSSYILGDILYGNAGNGLTTLAGNTLASRRWLSQTGTGSASAIPAWAQPACADLSNASASCAIDATNASNIGSGTLAAARLPTNGVANTNLAQMGAATLKGNPTNATANVTDFTIQGLTARGAPDATNDKIPLYDNAAGTIKYVTPQQIASAGVSGVSSIAGNSGAFTLSGLLTNSVNDLRVTAATKADQQTGTSTTTVVTPAQQQQHDSAAKVYATWVGSTGAPLSTYNSSGISRVSTGTYNISFSVAFASANYVCTVTPEASATFLIAQVTTKATTSVNVSVANLSGSVTDPVNVHLACFGRQ